MRRVALGVGLLVLAVLLGSGAGFVLSRLDGPPAAASTTSPTTRTPASSSAEPSTPSTPSESPTAQACPTTASPSFVPRSIRIAGETVPVIARPRDANGVPGTPPIDGTGKREFAFDTDQGIRPGDAAGHVLLNAHTWPDGSALGNRLLDQLGKGDRIVVRGAGAGTAAPELCYRVTERVEVLASKGYPRYYATTGKPALAIIVCSGRRLGPGEWEKRTIWFAGPAA
jgi:hypothetical protein